MRTSDRGARGCWRTSISRVAAVLLLCLLVRSVSAGLLPRCTPRPSEAEPCALASDSCAALRQGRAGVQRQALRAPLGTSAAAAPADPGAGTARGRGSDAAAQRPAASGAEPGAAVTPGEARRQLWVVTGLLYGLGGGQPSGLKLAMAAFAQRR